MLRAFSTLSGKLVWQYDTTHEFKTVNGIAGKGGSIGSAGLTVANGMVFVGSGYTGWQGGDPGNVLLCFTPYDRIPATTKPLATQNQTSESATRNGR